MRYPQPSDANATQSFGFWWTYDGPTGANVCATDGASFLRILRTTLGLSPVAAWDAEVTARLVATARRFDAEGAGLGWDTIAATLQREATAPSVTSLAFALYLAYYRTYGRFDAISIPAGTAFPRVGVLIADSGDPGGVVCWVPPNDASPWASDIPPAEVARWRAESASGWRVHPGEPSPSPVVHSTGGLSSGASAAVAIGALVVLVGLAAVGMYANRSAARLAYAPARARRIRGRR